MTDHGTIKIPQDAYENHNEHRKDLRMTWEEYIGSEAPEPSDAQIEIDMSEVLEKLEQLESAQAGTVDKAMSMNTEVNESEIARMVTNDIMAELPRKVAEEVRR